MHRALCIGINRYPIPDADLKGCINDAKGWATLLREHYDFAKSDVRLLTNSQATKKAILAGIDALLAGAKRGDVLVLSWSSHGTYVADHNGDEPVYDEAMCPFDVDDNLIIDDELREKISGMTPGVRLTVIADSCHSGTVTRGLVAGIATPDHRRVRFLSPKDLHRRTIADMRQRAAPRPDQAPLGPEVLLAGCKASQSSYDAQFGRTSHGAMSYFAQQLIAESGYRITYAKLADKLRDRLETAEFDQEPQLEGVAAWNRRQVFT